MMIGHRWKQVMKCVVPNGIGVQQPGKEITSCEITRVVQVLRCGHPVFTVTDEMVIRQKTHLVEQQDTDAQRIEHRNSCPIVHA